jgi:hypothetical protein
MSRTTVIVLVVLGAALAGFAFASTADRIRGEKAAEEPSIAAGPQDAELGWRETFGPPGERLVFTVRSVDVVPDGWRVKLGLENDSSVAFGMGDSRATLDRSFGLMLFETGTGDELEERNKNGTLPAVRAATHYEPELPAILEPGASWEGTISAAGALVAGSWIRVVFGTLVAVGKPPDELAGNIVWITDNTYELRE